MVICNISFRKLTFSHLKQEVLKPFKQAKFIRSIKCKGDSYIKITLKVNDDRKKKVNDEESAVHF